MISAEQPGEWNGIGWLEADSIAKALRPVKKKLPDFSRNTNCWSACAPGLNERAQPGLHRRHLVQRAVAAEYNRIRMSLLETIDAWHTDDFQQPILRAPKG